MADASCSAVLIVRNEEAVIEECLHSVRPVVDDIVVLDTGSIDQTRDRARSAGARVVESTWRDDFAAARNEALAHARGQWILSIDADERLLRNSARTLAQLLVQSSPIAYRVSLRPGPAFTPYGHCRLFRNDPHIRFEGRIRESVMPSIRRLNATVGDCDLAIEHLDDPAVRVGKHARDLALLQQAIRDDGDNVLYWTDLGRAHAALGETDAALNAWRRAIDLVRHRGEDSLTDSLAFTDVLQRQGTYAGDRKGLLDEACARFPRNRLLVWLRAEALVAGSQFAEAQPLLLDLVREGERDPHAALAYDRRIFKEFAYGALAACCSALEQWPEAAEWYGRAVAEQPASLEYRARYRVALKRLATSDAAARSSP